MKLFMEILSNLLVLVVFLQVRVRGDDLVIEHLDKLETCNVVSKKGDWLKVHYKGTLSSDGSQFDSSYDRGSPFEFLLGHGEVIKGWDEGLVGMCVGEKRRLTVPPDMGYGEKGAGDVIPGGATLIFEIELVAIEDAPKPTNIFKDIDKDEDNMLSQDEVSEFIRKQEQENGIDAFEEDAHNSMIVDIFESEDTNRDGFISHEEFKGPKHDEF